MNAGYLLDTSFLVDYERETVAGVPGPATRTINSLPASARCYVSPVTVAEILEGADDPAESTRALATYQQQTMGWAVALRCAAQQSRAPHRLAENDAWQAALAVGGGLTLVGHDKAFERVPGLIYRDHRAA
jgi:predicted nucleic acid-binding protein